MEHKIFVRIKSGEYVEALDLSRGRRAVLHLKTIEDYQTAAEIPLFLVRGGERTPLAVLSVEGLTPLSSEECRLDLETRLHRGRRAEFRVVQNGRLIRAENLRLPTPGGGRRILAAAAILVGAAGLVLLSALLIRGGSADSSSGPAGAPAPRAAASDPGAERTPSQASSTPASPPAAADSAAASAAPADSSAPAALQAAAAPVGADPLAAAREAFRALGEETVTIYFSADSAEILRGQLDKLETAAALLVRYPDLEITISGHCATAGTEKGRMALSRDRARAVYAALAAAGWKPKTAPVVEGFGDERPATRAENEQALNRRVEIRLGP